MTRETDKQFLLRVLSDERPHTLNAILWRSFDERGCGITVHSRAADLRGDGWDVRNTHASRGKRGDSSVYQLHGRLWPLECASDPGSDGNLAVSRRRGDAHSSGDGSSTPARVTAEIPANVAAQLSLMDVAA